MEYAYTFIKRYYPALTIAGIAVIVYLPYLFGYVPLSLGALTKYGVFGFLLSGSNGWINFSKHMGEFVGADYHYGFFNPFYLLIKHVGVNSPYYAESVLTVAFFIGALVASYFFLKQSGFSRWVSIFSASVYVLAGFNFKDDQSTSLGLSNLVFLPLFFFLIARGLGQWWEKIAFIILLWLESTYANPQLIFWQLILISAYVLLYKREVLLKLILLSVVAGILMLPQFLFTASLFTLDMQSSGAQVFEAELGLLHLVQLFFPLTSYPPHGQDYITPFYYTNILAALVFALYIPFLIRKRKELPNIVLFFFITALLSFAATIKGNPIQYIIDNLPFIDTFLARSPFRYLHLYFFAMSFVVAYCLSLISAEKGRVLWLSTQLLFIGALVTSGFLISTAVFFAFGDGIYSQLGSHILARELQSASGHYPEEYYANYLHTLYDRQFARFTLTSWEGFLTALPFIMFAIWGFAIRKREKLATYWPIFAIATIIPTSLMFNVIFWQVSAKLPSHTESNIIHAIQERENPQESYVLPYGVNTGESFIRNSYFNTPAILFWLTDNYFSCNTLPYGPLPSLQSQTNPFRTTRPLMVAEYIGYTCSSTNLDINNNVDADDRNRVDPAEAEANLVDRLGFLQAIGVRYVVTHMEFSHPSLQLISTEIFGERSDLIPDVAATLRMYEIPNPGSLAFIPPRVQEMARTEQDMLDVAHVQKVFDGMNYEGVSYVETGSVDARIVQQNTDGIVEVESKNNNALVIKTILETESYVIININHYPGWTATIDYAPTPIYRANINFVTVRVPEGTHTVRLTFDPVPMILSP